MDLLLVSVGSTPRPEQLAAALEEAGAGRVEAHRVGSDQGSVDAALHTLDERRLVIAADLAGVNLVLGRMMRAGLLETAETAVLTRSPIRYLTRIGLPADRAGQLTTAVTGRPRLVGVVKDDSGGLCVDGAALSPWMSGQSGDSWWLRALVDDQRLADGPARALSVQRLGPSELEATATFGRLRRRSCRGRSLQLACDDALIVADGVPRERPRSKRTFWSEPKLWRLALP